MRRNNVPMTMKRKKLKKLKRPVSSGARNLSVQSVKTPKIWSIKKADDEFSLWVRNRDGQCLFPGCVQTEIKKLQCSHYIGRAHKNTRFDPENCIALCMYHHFMSRLLGFEYQKQTLEAQGYDGQYTIFMKRYLGTDRFQALVGRSRQTKNVTSAILELMQFLGELP